MGRSRHPAASRKIETRNWKSEEWARSVRLRSGKVLLRFLERLTLHEVYDLPDKARERFYVKALCKAVVELSTCEVQDHESPDFLLDRNGHRLGVELTAFHFPPASGDRPHQEQQSLKDRIVEAAQRLHHAAGGPALYVSVYFDGHQTLTKKDTKPLAQAIADAVLNYPVPNSVKDPSIEIPWDHRPERIAGIRIHGSLNSVDKLWQSDNGGWVAEISSDHVAQVVRTKAGRVSLARRNCDELWLVIVEDLASNAAPAEISKEALETTYEAPFDRLIWLLPHGPQAIDLRLRLAVDWR